MTKFKEFITTALLLSVWAVPGLLIVLEVGGYLAPARAALKALLGA